MKILLLLLGLIVLARSCPPPFGNYRYMGNNTHNGTEIMRDDISRLPKGMAWTEIVSSLKSPREVWPSGTIHYCWSDQSLKDSMREIFIAALGFWEAKLGPPSRENGHQVLFEEFPFRDRNWPFCFAPGGGRQKHPEFDNDVLVLQPTDASRYLDSTPGYVPAERDDTFARHSVWINYHRLINDVNNLVLAPQFVAHELGHVLGLWHEHQRPDRDNRVHFECSNLVGYKEAKSKVEFDPLLPGDTIEMLCADGNIAQVYGFTAVKDFSTIAKIDQDDFWEQTYDKDHYDEKSIMHYNSWAWVEEGKDYCQKTEMPLTFWKNRDAKNFFPPQYPRESDLEWITYYRVVSDYDAAAIKRLYPWQE